MGPSPSELDQRLRAAQRLDEVAETAELMGDHAGAERYRVEAVGCRMAAMQLLDD